MKKTFSYIFLSLILVGPVNAVPQLTNQLAKDIGRSYGFFIGQMHTLDVISERFPALAAQAEMSEMEFDLSYGSSIRAIDKYMSDSVASQWVGIKKELSAQIKGNKYPQSITKAEAEKFIELVNERAKGNIESPVIETYLQFNPRYQKNPSQELADGFRQKFSSNGEGKAKGVAFDIEIPKSWKSMEAKRPNIVRKFISDNGRGSDMFMVLVNDMSLAPGEVITQKDINEVLTGEGVKDLIPEGATYIDSGPLTLENLPGYWIKTSMEISRVRKTVKIESITYSILYKNKLIQLQGQVLKTINDQQTTTKGMTANEPLFDLIANSFVIPELYK